MRIQDPNFPAEVHPTVQDGFADVIGVINNGSYEFSVQAGFPTDTPEGSSAVRFVVDPFTGDMVMAVWIAQLNRWSAFVPA